MKFDRVFNFANRQRGLSLVELMIAMLLGLFLMGIVLGVIVDSKNSFVFTRELATVQENGRYAMQLLTQEIRMAGYQECARNNASLANSLSNSAGTWYLSWPGPASGAPLGLQGIQGFEGVGNPASSSVWPADYRNNVLANTDSIVVRRGDSTSYQVVTHIPPTFTLNKATDLRLGELVMVINSSCTQVGIFQTNSATGTTVTHPSGNGIVSPGNCAAELGGKYNCSNTTAKSLLSYTSGSTLMRYNATAFYVAQSTGAAVNQPPALYRRQWLPSGTPPSLTPRSDELVRGIEDMQITYGLDTADASGAAVDNVAIFGDGVADTYVKADDARLTAWNAGTNWNSVVSVRVTLQLRSINPVYSTNTAFQTCNNAAGVPDKYIHKCMTSTIAVRNFGY